MYVATLLTLYTGIARVFPRELQIRYLPALEQPRDAQKEVQMELLGRSSDASNTKR
jgi:hypothetical protein